MTKNFRVTYRQPYADSLNAPMQIVVPAASPAAASNHVIRVGRAAGLGTLEIVSVEEEKQS